MATAEQLRGAIEPGSVPYGERQGLEQGLGEVAGGRPAAQGGAAPARGGAEAAIPPSPSDPLGMLLGGSIPPGDDPLTAGLSVGPGPGSPQEENPWTDNYTERLRLIAQHAKSPLLRAQARAALRYRVRGTGELQ